MYKITIPIIFILSLIISLNKSIAQNNFIISGSVKKEGTGKPIQNATIHLQRNNSNTLSNIDGSFKFYSPGWQDSLVITSVGFESLSILLQYNNLTNLQIMMKTKTNALAEVIIGLTKKPGKSFTQKVINHKKDNNPSRFSSYSYQRYTRNELDIDHIDFKKASGSGLKSLMLKTYNSIDSNAKDDKELPVYFAERLTNNYHAASPATDRENIIAKKTLGLKTDNLITKLDKFYFNFNIYDEWIPIFDQTYVSPLNTNAFRSCLS